MNFINEGKFWQAIGRDRPMYKPEIIRINISSSFMSRARCKQCGDGPDFYYAMMKPHKWKNVRHFLVYSKAVKSWIQRMLSNWYLPYTPRYFHDLSDFTFRLESKSFDPSLYRVRGANISERDDVIEFLGCECGATVWAFNDKSTKNRPEITNRKGRYKYPQRFVY
jgi:hypothetical protein